MTGTYHSLTSERLGQAVMALPGLDIRCSARAVKVGPQAVQLADGQTLGARLVIDGRGAGDSAGLVLRYQKFLGQELLLTAPHGLTGPAAHGCDGGAAGRLSLRLPATLWS